MVIGCRLTAAMLTWCCIIGCATPTGSNALAISGEDYQQAFDAAVEVARQESLIGGLRDIRSGVIETDPVYVPTLLEPWHAHREALDRLVESTISFQRRRARFEFMPDEATGELPLDLSDYDGNLQLRVFVHVDRMHVVGRRRSTWTRRIASFEDAQDEHDLMRRSWEPVGRDTSMEQRLLAKLQAAMHD